MRSGGTTEDGGEREREREKERERKAQGGAIQHLE